VYVQKLMGLYVMVGSAAVVVGVAFSMSEHQMFYAGTIISSYAQKRE
jgi:hypothetical protein